MPSTMTDPDRQSWAFQIKASSLPRIVALRLESDLEISVVRNPAPAISLAGVSLAGDSMHWVRGRGLSSERFRVLAAVSDTEIFLVDDQNRLTPRTGTVPIGRLPELDWKSLSEFISARHPVPRRIADSLLRIDVSLCRSAEVRDAVAMIAEWRSFLEWGLSAPEVRLRPLKYAVSGQQVLILGHPLPPLTGERFWEAGRVFVPLGFSWQPAVEQAALCKSLELQFSHSHPENQHINTNSLMFVWRENPEQVQPVQAEDLEAVSRASLRQTALMLMENHGWTDEIRGKE